MLSGTSPRVRHTGQAQEPPALRSLRGHRQGLGCMWLLGPGAAVATKDKLCVWGGCRNVYGVGWEQPLKEIVQPGGLTRPV